MAEGPDGRRGKRSARRHAHRLGRADRDGRRPRAARRRVPPGRRRPAIRCILTYGPYGKGLAFQDGYPSAWELMVAEHPDVAYGSTQPVPELGSRRSREVGAGRLRLRARRFARRRPLARAVIDPFSPRETQRLLRLHRMGRRAAVVERQGRAERHLLLRHQPVARRVAAAAASRRDVRLGRRRRLVPRHDAPRRHPQHVLRRTGTTCRSRPCSTAAASAGRRAACTGELVCGDETLSDEELATNRGDFGDDILAHPLDDEYHRARSPQLGQDHGAAALRRELGRPGPAPARQLRRLRARGVEGEVARSARARALDALLHRLRRAAPEALLRPFPEGRGRTAGSEQPRVQLQVRHVDKFVERHENEWPLARTQWTQALPRSRQAQLTPRSARKSARSGDVRRAGRRRSRSSRAPLEAETEITGPLARAALRLVFDDRTPTSSSCCASSRPICAKSCSRARSIRTRRSRRAGCAPRTASSTRSSRRRTGPYHTHDERQPLTPRRDRRARRRDLADVHRRARGLSHRADGARQGLRIREVDAARGCRTSRTSCSGCGPFLHDDPRDRPKAVFGGRTTLLHRSAAPGVRAAPGHPARVGCAGCAPATRLSI